MTDRIRKNVSEPFSLLISIELRPTSTFPAPSRFSFAFPRRCFLLDSIESEGDREGFEDRNVFKGIGHQLVLLACCHATIFITGKRYALELFHLPIPTEQNPQSAFPFTRLRTQDLSPWQTDLALVMPSVKSSRHILFHRRQALPCDDLGTDSSLDRDLEELSRDDLFWEARKNYQVRPGRMRFDNSIWMTQRGDEVAYLV